MELVTAVITTHKREATMVERALKSILAQTYKNIEVIVVDDSPSTFEHRQAVKECVKKYFSQNVIYVQHEECQGACAARNTGLALAKGSFIAFLDDDDEWLPNKIEKQIQGFYNDNVALVYCDSISYFQKSGQKILRNPVFLCGKVYNQLILRNFIGSTSFPLIKRQSLIDVGGFDVLMQSAQDYDVWLRLAQKFEVNYVKDALVMYYIHEGEQITKNCKKKISGLERINEKNWEYIKRTPEAFWIRTIKLVPFYACNGEYKKAFFIWIKAILRKPFKIKANLKYLYIIIRECICKNK